MRVAFSVATQRHISASKSSHGTSLTTWQELVPASCLTVDAFNMSSGRRLLLHTTEPDPCASAASDCRVVEWLLVAHVRIRRRRTREGEWRVSVWVLAQCHRGARTAFNDGTVTRGLSVAECEWGPPLQVWCDRVAVNVTRARQDPNGRGKHAQTCTGAPMRVTQAGH